MTFVSNFLVFVCNAIILGFFTRFLAGKYPDSMLGKFTAFVW